MEEVNLTHQFLIAMPAMEDPNFSRTLTYICEHNEDGAVGIIVNRPTEMTVANLFERVGLPLEKEELSSQPVYYGGPVQPERGFVLHRPLGDWQATMIVNHEMGLTSSRDILQSMSEHGEPEENLITLGYASWTAGQLEWELTQNAWLTVEADPKIIFGLPPEERLAAAMHSLGVDFTNLSEVAGHA